MFLQLLTNSWYLFYEKRILLVVISHKMIHEIKKTAIFTHTENIKTKEEKITPTLCNKKNQMR